MSDEPEIPPANREIGKLALSIYRGVLEDGGSEKEATNVTAAFFFAAFLSPAQSSDQPDT